ncbi:TetR/AcrR family transcriptional regulator [Embleya sp. NPDC005971]|uniref:TetR/AcrR family transcriptional regulator n=1 Tax=unclassified Embleya TaxID=2699296 RepID=UPI0033C7D917
MTASSETAGGVAKARVELPSRSAAGRKRGAYAKTEARRTEILDAALAAFGRSGYRAGSVREIAKLVGMSPAGMLHHFDNKETLLAAVLEHREGIAHRVASRHGITGLDTLVGLVELARYNSTHRGIVELYCIVSAEATAADHPAHPYFVARYRRVRTRIAEALEHAARKGELRAGVVPARAARAAVALMDGLQVQWLLEPDEVDMPGELAEHFAALVKPGAWRRALAAALAPTGYEGFPDDRPGSAKNMAGPGAGNSPDAHNTPIEEVGP